MSTHVRFNRFTHFANEAHPQPCALTDAITEWSTSPAAAAGVKTVRAALQRDIAANIRDRKGKLKKTHSKRAKAALPVHTFNGEFRHRSVAGYLAPSGLMVLDIDDVAANDAPTLRDRLFVDERVVMSAVSPSGTGVKLLLRVPLIAPTPDDDNLTANNRFHAVFEAAAVEFARRHDVVLDPSGKNLDRLCYVGFDPEARCRDFDAAAEFAPPLETPATPLTLPKQPPAPILRAARSYPHDDDPTFRQAVLTVLRETPGLVDTYDMWFRVMAACNEAGVTYNDFDALCQNSAGYDAAANAKAWAKHKPRAGSRATFGTLVHLATETPDRADRLQTLMAAARAATNAVAAAMVKAVASDYQIDVTLADGQYLVDVDGVMDAIMRPDVRSIAIHGDTGVGKTTLARKIAKLTGRPVILAVPTRLTAQNKANDLNDNDVEVRFQVVIGGVAFDENDQQHSAVTFDSVGKIPAYVLAAGILLIDESHELVCALAYRSKAIRSLLAIAAQMPKVVYLTGTPVPSYIDDMPVDFRIRARRTRRIRGIRKACATPKATMLRDKRAALAHGEKQTWLVYCRTRSQTERYTKWATRRSLRAAFVHRYNVTDAAHRDLIDGRVDHELDFLFVTCYPALGLDIRDHTIGAVVFLHPTDPLTMRQLAGRVRQGEPVVIILTAGVKERIAVPRQKAPARCERRETGLRWSVDEQGGDAETSRLNAPRIRTTRITRVTPRAARKSLTDFARVKAELTEYQRRQLAYFQRQQRQQRYSRETWDTFGLLQDKLMSVTYEGVEAHDDIITAALWRQYVIDCASIPEFCKAELARYGIDVQDVSDQAALTFEDKAAFNEACKEQQQADDAMFETDLNAAALMTRQGLKESCDAGTATPAGGKLNALSRAYAETKHVRQDDKRRALQCLSTIGRSNRAFDRALDRVKVLKYLRAAETNHTANAGLTALLDHAKTLGAQPVLLTAQETAAALSATLRDYADATGDPRISPSVRTPSGTPRNMSAPRAVRWMAALFAGRRTTAWREVGFDDDGVVEMARVNVWAWDVSTLLAEYAAPLPEAWEAAITDDANQPETVDVEKRKPIIHLSKNERNTIPTRKVNNLIAADDDWAAESSVDAYRRCAA